MKKYNSRFLHVYASKDCVSAWRWFISKDRLKLRIKTRKWFMTLFNKPKDSYLLGELPKGTYMERHMYLKLSSLRNYFDYIESKEVTLPFILGLEYYSKLQIVTNRLLNVIDGEIYFKNEVI